ncbi:Uncharacterised protein [Mycobacteroides abscessus subsp. abscessus]|nr:Uncharacterised protein [Mycobacteroides abscessus subsp. abscessus]
MRFCMRILRKIKAKKTSLAKALNVQWSRKSFNWLIATNTSVAKVH